MTVHHFDGQQLNVWRVLCDGCRHCSAVIGSIDGVIEEALLAQVNAGQHWHTREPFGCDSGVEHDDCVPHDGRV
jgi:hypothetical protein